jgi:thiol-disulfide isomerase/thioredoxin
VVTHQKEFEAKERKFNMGEKSLNGYEIKKLWRNEDGRHFSDVSIASGAGDLHDARGYIACDFDGDGDLDLFIRNYHQDSVFLRNEGVKNHWLKVKPTATVSNRSAIGARVEIEIAGKRQIRWITAGSGYLMQQPNEAYFGLGSATRVDAITITWPNGNVQKFGGADADTYVRVTEGKEGMEIIPNCKQPVLAPVDLGSDDALFEKLAACDVKDLDGNKVDLGHLPKTTLVAFWATWCNVCRGEFGDIASLAKTQAKAGLDVVSIAVLDPQGPELRKTCEELKPGFKVWTMSREDYDRVFGKDAPVPKTVLLEKGRVSAVFNGKLRPYLVKAYVLDALRAK